MDGETSLMPNSSGCDFESIESKTLVRLARHDLPASLDTGIDVVDFEHAQLLSCMATLRQLCVDTSRDSCHLCEDAQRVNCESSLIGLLGDLLMFIIDHFHQEEKAMRESLLYMLDRDVCEAHMEDHAQISERIQKIVAANNLAKTVVQVRELERLLDEWVSHHVVLHDLALMKWMARQDSIISLYSKA